MPNHPPAITRRDVLTGLIAAGASSLLPDTLGAQTPATQPAATQGAGAFRFVHMSDIHVMPERNASKGFAAALRACEMLRPKPDFILTGGDLVFDVLEATPQRARELFALYKHIIGENTGLRVYDTIGNHDVFGWSANNGVTPTSPGYGKALVKESLGLPETHYRFDHKGWRFLVLDNIQIGKGNRGYTGFVDEAQTDWLTRELKATDAAMPIVMCEHIPTVTVTPAWFRSNVKEGEWRMSSGLVCTDAPARLRLMADRNVRLSLSGHIHQQDRIDFRGTTFICDGAVSGGWWKGSHEGTPEGFGVIDVHANGRIDHHYLTYGWKAG